MDTKYKKIPIAMKLIDNRWRLWKTMNPQITCFFEQYRNKRSIFIKISNILSSVELEHREKREYHLMLMGVDRNQLIYKDFGRMFVNQLGEGFLFKKFNDTPLENYSHCLVAAISKADEPPMTVISGEMPGCKAIDGEEFSVEDLINRSEEIKNLFSEEIDQSKARWYRVVSLDSIPQCIKGEKDLIEKYNHYIVGKTEKSLLVGIPGRFIKAEQPSGMSLWQPINGGEKYIESLEKMPASLCEKIFGYWIGETDLSGTELREI